MRGNCDASHDATIGGSVCWAPPFRRYETFGDLIILTGFPAGFGSAMLLT